MRYLTLIARWVAAGASPACWALALAALAAPALAGTGRVDPQTGRIDFTAKFLTPPEQDEIDEFKAAVTQASAILCDATDGWMRLGTVTLTGGSKVGFDQADMLVYLDKARSTADTCWEGPNQPCFALEKLNHKIKIYRDPTNASYDAPTIAHELGHLVLDLAEDYDEQSRMGAAWGIGRSIECSDLSPTHNSIMQGYDKDCPPFTDITELTVASNHDSVRGDPNFPDNFPTCTAVEDIECDPPRPSADACQFYNIDTCRYELASQSGWSFEKFGEVLSDWEHLALTHPFVTPPANLPAPAPDGFCAIPPVFFEDLEPADQVMFVLDRSWSMNFATSIGQCDVAGCPDLCENGYDDDQDGFADALDPEGCEELETRWKYLRGAIGAFMLLHEGSGLAEDPATVDAAVSSFNCSPTLDLEMTPLTSFTRTNQFNPALNGLELGGDTGIGDALAFAATQFPQGEDASAHKAILLVTDGHNNCGADPGVIADNMRVPVFFVPVGAASDSDALGAIPQQTGGKLVDSADARELVSALVQQWANYAGASQIVPRMPFAINVAGTFQNPATARTPGSWLDGGSPPPGCPDGFPCKNSVFKVPVEPGVRQLVVALAGDMDSMTGFGVRALLSGPAGANPDSYDSEIAAPDPTIRVSRDDFWLILQIQKPNPGMWTIDVRPRGLPGEPAIQSGNLTVIAESGPTHLGTTLDRYVVDDPQVPVQLSIRPLFTNTILGITPQVRVFLPDGSSQPVAIVDRTAFHAGYTAEIANLPFKGRYEVRVLLDTPPTAIADPGESLFGGTGVPVSVPPLVRTASEYFYVSTGAVPCPSGTADCDGDGIVGESTILDLDGDGLPDAYDTDSDEDQIPDDFEWNGALVDSDRDGTADPYDPDADGDGTRDSNDPQLDINAPHHAVGLGHIVLEGGLGGWIGARLGSDEPVAGLALGLKWQPTALDVLAIHLGPDVPASSVAYFNVQIGTSPLNAGEALVDLVLVPGATLGPANGMRLLQIEVAPQATMPPGSEAAICFADGLGLPPRATTVTVVRPAGTASVVPTKFCGSVTAVDDVHPPQVICVDAIVAAGPSCAATWSTLPFASDNCTPSPALVTMPPLPQTFGLGNHVVLATATDPSGNVGQCETVVTVADLTPPTGGIVGLLDGFCTPGPVVAQDDFADACDTSVLRTYAPAGGPTYASHGDVALTVTASDTAGNLVRDSRAFTIDLVAPVVAIDPGFVMLDLSTTVGFDQVFSATDADGASGGVVAERLLLDGCLVYDGATHGDADGLLADETMAFDVGAACEARARCGLTALDDPELRVEADDCAGHTGSDTATISLSRPIAASDCAPALFVAKLAGGSAEVRWTPVFAPESWDLVRGELAALAAGTGGTVDLGAVTCLADDLAVTSFTDASDPASGRGHYYLLRYEHGATVSEYGFSSAGGKRVPSSGGCAPAP